MKTLSQLNQELLDLQIAFNNKHVSANEYSSIYYNINQQIKRAAN